MTAAPEVEVIKDYQASSQVSFILSKSLKINLFPSFIHLAVSKVQHSASQIHIQSPPKILERQRQFSWFCCTLSPSVCSGGIGLGLYNSVRPHCVKCLEMIKLNLIESKIFGFTIKR